MPVMESKQDRITEDEAAAGELAAAKDPRRGVSAVALRLGEDCPLSAVHTHQIKYHMCNMIGVTSTSVRGQNIYVFYQSEKATVSQVKNYLCAALHVFGTRWREAVRAAPCVTLRR